MANETMRADGTFWLDAWRRAMAASGVPADRQKYLTGNWAVSLDDAQRAATADEFVVPYVDPSRYPHTCPRCQGPAYVGAVEVDCAGGCK